MGIFFGPCHHAFGSVHMGDSCPCLRGGYRCPACIGEQVEDPDFSARRDGPADQAGAPVPVDGLFREQARMLKTEGLEIEIEIPVMNDPFLGQVEEFPFPAAFAAPVVMTVGLFPLASPGRFPDDLGIRTDQLIAAPELQLLTSGGIQYLIVFPLIRDPHNILYSLSLNF